MHSGLCIYGKDFGKLEQTCRRVKQKTLLPEKQRILKSLILETMQKGIDKVRQIKNS